MASYVLGLIYYIMKIFVEIHNGTNILQNIKNNYQYIIFYTIQKIFNVDVWGIKYETSFLSR